MMPEFNEEQLEQIRFCLSHWQRIEYFKRKRLFDYKNGSITLNFKPLGEIQSVHYHEVDNECDLSYPQF